MYAYFGLIVVCVYFIHSSRASDNMESMLYKRVMDGYDKHARPAPNVTDPVHVHFQLELQQIIDVDKFDVQCLIFAAECMVTLRMERLSIDMEPRGFWNDSRPKIPIWISVVCIFWTDLSGESHLVHLYFRKPDVLLFNSVDTEFDTSYPSNMVVYSDGLVVWIPPSITRSSCKMDIRYFPFDDQVCYMKYGSWTFGKSRLTLHKLSKGIDTTEYQTLHNDEWTLLATPVTLTDYEYNNEWYQSLYVNFHLRRRTLYYAFNIITPSLLITGMSIVGFSLPVEAGEKVALEITVLASICICFDIVAKVTPPTSESIPLLGLFFFCHMVIVTISTVASVFILNLNYRTVKTHVMGDWTRKILLNWLPWLLMMKRPEQTLQPPPCIPKYARKKCTEEEIDLKDDWCHICQKTNGAHHGRGLRLFIISNRLDYGFCPEGDCSSIESRIEACLDKLNSRKKIQLNKNPHSDTQNGGQKSGEAIYDILAMLMELYEKIKMMTDKVPQADQEDEVKNDWEFAGMVIDKVCLILFTTLIACSTMIIVFSAPHVMA